MVKGAPLYMLLSMYLALRLAHRFYLRNVTRAQVLLDVFWHLQLGRSHVAQVDTVERQQSCQRVNRTPVLQVSHHGDLEKQKTDYITHRLLSAYKGNSIQSFHSLWVQVYLL